jgi:broad specificity phosphatase PhoE
LALEPVISYGAGMPSRSDSGCRRLYLVRHGETLYRGEIEGALPGRELTERGCRQIEALAELFAEVPLDAIYTSPLGRAQATAEMIARRNGAPVTTVEALREIQVGDVLGREMAELFAAVRAFFADPSTHWDTPYLGGETYRQLRERVWPLVDEHCRRSDWRRIALVAHGGVNNAIIGHVLGAGGPGLANVEQDFGCVNIIDVLGDRPVLRLLNFTAYDPLKTGLEVPSLDVLREVLETALHLSLDEGSGGAPAPGRDETR